MTLNEGGKHSYLGEANSRGKRVFSKIHKGLDSGDIEKAFENLNTFRIKQAKFREKLKRKGIL